MESIKNQIEFYFSEANLHKDKFMRQQIAANSQSMVPVSTIAKFKRVESLSTDLDTILKSIQMSDILQLNEDSTMVGRKQPFSLDAKYENANKTLRVEGLPAEATLDEIMEFFKQQAPIACVRRQTDRSTKQFVGIAWVDFEKEEDCKRVLESTGLKYGENELKMMLKADFKAHRDADKKKSGDGNGADPAAAASGEEVEEEIVFPSGHLLKVIFASPAADGASLPQISPMEVKKFFTENHGKALYVESKAPLELVVRFEESIAQQIKDKLTATTETAAKEEEKPSPLQLVGHPVESLAVLEGEEELEQWRKIAADKKSAIGNKRGRDSGRGRGGFRKKHRR